MGIEMTRGIGTASSEERRQRVATAAPDAGDRVWQGLFKAGGTAALIAGLVFRRNLDAELMLLKGMGIIQAGPAAMPATAEDWFTLLHNNRLLGLTLLNLFDVVNCLLVALMFLALCVALRRVNRPAMMIAAALTVTAVVLYLASNQALTMLALSDQYSGASTAAQRSTLLAAGQAALAIHRNATYAAGSNIYPSFFLVSVAGLMIAAVMLRSAMFSRVSAYVGILANVVGLGYYITLTVAPALVALPLSISAIFLLTWYVLIGVGLLVLGRPDRTKGIER